MSNTKVSRRDFVKGSAMAATIAGISMPFNILQAGVSPNEKINVAFIGMGCRGAAHASKKMILHKTIEPGINILSWTDAIKTPYEKWSSCYGVKDAIELLKKKTHYFDYRKMLDKEKDIDAVMVATTHSANFAAARWAIEMGKHVYSEKPTGVTVEETFMMREAILKNKVVTQMGNQGASYALGSTFPNVAEAKTLGEIREMHIALSPHKYVELPLTGKGQAIPDNINWDAYLSVEQNKPFPGAGINHGMSFWGSILGFGIGIIGDWGTHTCTASQFGLQLINPTSITLEHQELIPNSKRREMNCTVKYKYPQRGDLAPIDVYFHFGTNKYRVGRMPFPEEMNPERKKRLMNAPDGSGPTHGLHLFIGDKACATSGKYCGGFTVLGDEKRKELTPKIKSAPKKYLSPKGYGGLHGHVKHWTDSIRTNDYHAPQSNWLDYGGPLMEFLNMGHIGLRRGEVGKELIWDNKNRKFTNDEIASAMVSRTHRKEFVNW